MASLDNISSIGDPKTKGDRYKEFLSSIVSCGDIEKCKSFVEHGETLLWVV